MSSLCTQLSLRASRVKDKSSLEITEEDTRKPGGGEKSPLCGLLGAILCPNLAPRGKGNVCYGQEINRLDTGAPRPSG